LSIDLDLPFLSLPDPATTGEGVLDPLGLAAVADRLADQILPGLRARMSRPRFLTSIAVASVVCEGLEEVSGADGLTPAYLAFEWLLVEGFVRAGDKYSVQRTPGILKAREAKDSGEKMSPRAYLHIPTVFGFHGVYKPLARSLGVVDDDLNLSDNGYALLRCWEKEQGLEGFAGNAPSSGPGERVRKILHSAVEEALYNGHTTRSAGWREGWEFFADHLSPSQLGRDEAHRIHQLLLDSHAGLRGEVFRLVKPIRRQDISEAATVREVILKKASRELNAMVKAITAYEEVASLLEDAFDWIRYMSSAAGARAVTVSDFEHKRKATAIARNLPAALERAGRALECATAETQETFASLSGAFSGVSSPSDLFEAVLSRHGAVQKAKQPVGKRDWFERSSEGGAFVRIPYRLKAPPEAREYWNRPYRINAAISFNADLREGLA
jgi:hypothetical protein